MKLGELPEVPISPLVNVTVSAPAGASRTMTANPAANESDVAKARTLRIEIGQKLCICPTNQPLELRLARSRLGRLFRCFRHRTNRAQSCPPFDLARLFRSVPTHTVNDCRRPVFQLDPTLMGRWEDDARA